MARRALQQIAKQLNTTEAVTTVEASFLADLKRSIELTDEKNRRVPSKTYKPSSLQCIRNMYYQVTGAPMDKGSSNYSLIGICNSGTDIHQRIQQAVTDMKSNSIDCEYIDVAEYVQSRGLTDIEIVSKQGMETKLYHKRYNMSFLCDGIIRYNGHYYILELKTEASFKWTSRKGVDPKHYDQGTAYSIAFGIDEVLFVYINRDVLDMKSYMFIPTQDMKSDLLDKISSCNNYVTAKTVPPKPKVSGKICQYCSYRLQCEADTDMSEVLL